MEFIGEYWWLVLGLIVVVAIAIVLVRPRQRVQLSDSAPARPHMAKTAAPAEGRGLAGEAAAATGDVTGELLNAPVREKLDAGDGGGDDLCLLKGVGPKLADALKMIGFTRFEQLARLSSTEVERLDAQLGAFRGRISRDRIVEQAQYLAQNDIDGFEQKFGKL